MIRQIHKDPYKKRIIFNGEKQKNPLSKVYILDKAI